MELADRVELEVAKVDLLVARKRVGVLAEQLAGIRGRIDEANANIDQLQDKIMKMLQAG